MFQSCHKFSSVPPQFSSVSLSFPLLLQSFSMLLGFFHELHFQVFPCSSVFSLVLSFHAASKFSCWWGTPSPCSWPWNKKRVWSRRPGHCATPDSCFPWLSHLCSRVHLDKNVPLLESRALTFILSLTAALRLSVRAAACHLLDSLHNCLASAKIATEKQV